MGMAFVAFLDQQRTDVLLKKINLATVGWCGWRLPGYFFGGVERKRRYQASENGGFAKKRHRLTVSGVGTDVPRDAWGRRSNMSKVGSQTEFAAVSKHCSHHGKISQTPLLFMSKACGIVCQVYINLVIRQGMLRIVASEFHQLGCPVLLQPALVFPWRRSFRLFLPLRGQDR